MCEANVYINRNGLEELVMEKVDRIIPGDENNIFMENIFGERKVIQARIKEMQLVHHRIILDEINIEQNLQESEIWLNLDTDHGHFHQGEEIKLTLLKGYNMKADNKAVFIQPKVFILDHHECRECPAKIEDGIVTISPDKEADGLMQIYASETGDKELYAKIFVEVGHHHHHEVEPVGMPLEIVPCHYQHARMGESYEIQVLKNGSPLPGAVVKATHAGTSNHDYPHHLTTDQNGKVSIFLTARGNYLFSIGDEQIISTFTLTKSF